MPQQGNTIRIESMMPRFRKNYHNAFNDVFNELYPELCYYANRIIKNTDQAKDIVADCFTALWKKDKSDFESFEHVRQYLYKSTKNGCLDFLRDSDRKNKNHAFMAKSAELVQTDYYIRLETDIVKELYDHIERLPVKCREVFKLTYLCGMSRKEVADLLNISEETVKNHNANAMKTLKGVFAGRDVSLVYLIYISSMLNDKNMFN